MLLTVGAPFGSHIQGGLGHPLLSIDVWSNRADLKRKLFKCLAQSSVHIAFQVGVPGRPSQTTLEHTGTATVRYRCLSFIILGKQRRV